MKGTVTIPKEVLAQLPGATFDGEIRLIEDEGKLIEAIHYLNGQDTLGFDTETRPSFKKGMQNNVSLIQLATLDHAFLFRINKTGLHDELVNLIENPDIKKIGVSLKDDFHNLSKIKEFEPANFIELQQYGKNFGIADNSLSKIYGIIFGKRICKGQRLTNWEAETLTETQQNYAALDAVACLQIYEHLRSGNFDPFSSPFYSESSENGEVQ